MELYFVFSVSSVASGELLYHLSWSLLSLELELLAEAAGPLLAGQALYSHDCLPQLGVHDAILTPYPRHSHPTLHLRCALDFPLLCTSLFQRGDELRLIKHFEIGSSHFRIMHMLISHVDAEVLASHRWKSCLSPLVLDEFLLKLRPCLVFALLLLYIKWFMLLKRRFVPFEEDLVCFFGFAKHWALVVECKCLLLKLFVFGAESLVFAYARVVLSRWWMQRELWLCSDSSFWMNCWQLIVFGRWRS